MAQPIPSPPPPDPTERVEQTTVHVAIPPPCYKTEGELLSRIIDRVITCEGLIPTERQVLLGVLLYMPIANNKQLLNLQRILVFPSDLLRDVSHALESGLIAARGFGGRPGKSSTGSADTSGYASSKRDYPDDTLTENSISAVKRHCSTALSQNDPPDSTSHSENALINDNVDTQPPEGINTTETIVDTPDSRLLSALQIPYILPKSTDQYKLFNRRHTLADDCLLRQNDICPITGHKNDPYVLEAAHIVPHSTAAIINLDDTPFWRLLTICFGPEIRDAVYDIVGGGKSMQSTNGLAFDPTVHKLFDRGVIWLIPQINEPFDQETSSYYDVELCWRGELTELEGLGTIMPSTTDEQVDTSATSLRYHRGPLRPIKGGDRFRLFTNNPRKYPLTHPLLLSLHSALWNMISCSGLSETAKAKQYREVSRSVESTRRGSSSSSRRAHRYRKDGRGGGSRRDIFRTPQGDDPPGKDPTIENTTQSNHHLNMSASEPTKIPPTSEVFPLPIEVEFLQFKLRQVAAQHAREYDSDEYYSDGRDTDDYLSDSGGEYESGDEVNWASAPSKPGLDVY